MTIIQANKFYYLRGGAERYVFELSNYLEASGHRVVPFAMRHPENVHTQYDAFFPRFVPTDRVRFNFRALRTFGRLLYSREAKRGMEGLIREVHPSLCHVHNIYTQLSPSILAPLRQERIPVVMTVHDHHLISPQYNIWAKDCGEDLRDAGLVSATLSRFHKGSIAASFAQTLAHKWHKARGYYKTGVDRFITPSNYLKNQLVRGGFDSESIEVIPHGIDPDHVKPSYEHKGYMLFVGRLSEEKGVDTIIRMAKLIPDITFKIVGTGPSESYLHLLAHERDNVEFLGFKMGDALRELYQGAMAVLLPSQVEEVFPLTLLEAMAAGKPVIASEVGGVPELVDDRHTGFLVRPLDLHGWVEATMRLAYDDDLRRQMGREARLSTETTFHSKRHFQRVMAVYQQLAN